MSGQPWPEGPQIAQDYERGASAQTLAVRYHHGYQAMRRFLVDSGLWRDAKGRAGTRRSNRGKVPMAAPAPVDEPLEYLLGTGNPGDFWPMLTVEVASGRILLDRMEEALCQVNGMPYAGKGRQP